MLTLLSKVVANPFRDMSLYPLDHEQVDKLVASMKRHGFFGQVRARESADGKHIELGYGHHRIAAARKLGLTKVDIDVCKMSDDEMIRLMTSENAIQAGSKIAAIMNEVSAATRQLALCMLSVEHLSGIPETWREIAQCFQSAKAYDVARGSLEKGDGIGEPLVRTYLGGGEADFCPRTREQIKDGLAAFKAAGAYATTIAAVKDEIAREHAAAEQEAAEAEREAERASKKAKTKGEKARASKAATKAKAKRKRQTETSNASDRATRAAATSTEKHQRIFDEKCIPLFENDDQVRAFREAVTTGTAQRFIPVEKQYALAEKLMSSIGAGVAHENANNRGRVSAAYIKTYVSNVLSEAIAGQRELDEEERARLAAIQADEIFLAQIRELLWAVRSVAGIANKMFTFVRKHPERANDARLGAIVPKVDEAVAMLKAIQKVVNGENIKEGNGQGRRAIESHI